MGPCFPGALVMVRGSQRIILVGCHRIWVVQNSICYDVQYLFSESLTISEK
jgi:hypothetical protein